jgi:hypothetical protein
MLLAAMVIGPLAVSAHAESKSSLVFKKLGGDETNLTAIMEKWAAEELERQGGKYKSHGWWPWGLTAFDYDNDGDIDLLPTHHGTPGGILLASEFKETGKHTYVDVTETLGLPPRAFPGADKKPEIWDFNGDGWLDVAGFSDEAKPNSLFNVEGKAFTVLNGFHPISHPGPVEDVNGDGYPDLKARHRSFEYTCLYDPEAKAFKMSRAPTVIPAGVPKDFVDYVEELKAKVNDKGRKVNRFMGMGYKTGYDLNGDGKKDLIAAGSGGYGAQIIQRYFMAGEEGQFIDKTEEMGLPKIGTPIYIHDLDGDGAMDLLIAVGKDAGVYLNDGKGKYTHVDGDMTAFLAQRGPYLHEAFPCDLDNDGDVDLVLTNPRLGKEEVFENQGDGKFVSVFKARGWDSEPIAICDLNDDGLIDICIGGPSKTSITLYLNETTNENNYCNLYPRMAKPNPYAVGAVIEVFKAGALGKKDAHPFLTGTANKDASPFHIGLGKETAFDLRIAFPGKDPVELKNVTAKPKLKTTPEGTIAEMAAN